MNGVVYRESAEKGAVIAGTPFFTVEGHAGNNGAEIGMARIGNTDILKKSHFLSKLCSEKLLLPAY